MKGVVEFTDQEGVRAEEVGRKFAHLARARSRGFPVPEAVVLDVSVHRHFLKKGKWPARLWSKVLRRAEEIGLRHGLAVRSSGVEEDREEQSLAGRYQTTLQVQTPEELSSAIEACWRSAGPAAEDAAAGRTQEAAEGASLIAVILQRMVAAGISGVAFSRNPLYPARDETVIEAVEGLGSSLVSGAATPWRVFVTRPGEVQVEGEGRLRRRPLPSERLLDDHACRSIASMARSLADLLGRPQDIEWSLDTGGKLWLLQSRPITGLDERSYRLPQGEWTRRIAEDLWGDRLTPFLADRMLDHAARFDFSRIAGQAGVPFEQPTLRVLSGFLYLNGRNAANVLAAMPRRLRFEELLRLLPPEKRSLWREQPSPRPAAQAKTGLRFLLALLITPEGWPLLCGLRARRRIKDLEQRIKALERHPQGSKRQALLKLEKSAALLAEIQQANQWPYGYAYLLTWASKRLCEQWAGLGTADYLALLAARASNATVDMERAFRDLVQAFREEPVWQAKGGEAGAEPALEDLPERLRGKCEAYLERFGHRGVQRNLRMPRLAEEPERLLRMVRSSLSRSQPHDRAGASGKEQAASVRSRIPAAKRMLLVPLLSRTRAALDLREDLRFLLDRELALLRSTLLGLGQRLGLGEEVFSLTLGELRDAVKGSLGQERGREIAAARRAEEEGFEAPPDFFIDGRPQEDFQPEGDSLQGIGTSPGRATGAARRVDASTEPEVEEGDIVVAGSLDPGQAPLLGLAGGVVLQEGGLLNHCSIVARELGVPMVVGVKSAQRIATGQKISLDGSSGRVYLLDAGTENGSNGYASESPHLL